MQTTFRYATPELGVRVKEAAGKLDQGRGRPVAWIVNRALEAWLAHKESDPLTASEALYGFVGWLTSRPEKTVMSATDDAASIVSLIEEFRAAQNLPEPRNGWQKRLVLPAYPKAEGGS